jgi:heterodisulfide reductase subunit B
MKFAVQRCCTTPVLLKQYETSTNGVLDRLGVELVDIKDTGCCGYPLKTSNFMAYVLCSAKNLALAEKNDLNMMTFCNCCYGTLKHVNHLMTAHTSLRKEINAMLEKEGLTWHGDLEIKHLLQVFSQYIGIEKIKKSLVKTYKDLKIATHYGCHLLRPHKIIQFDNPDAPSTFDQLVEITGAQSIAWRNKLDCCGSPIWGINDSLSLDLTKKKLNGAQEAGADFFCVACPYCQLQFDRVQKISLAGDNSASYLPSVLFTQLLGLSLGIDERILGISQNELNSGGLLEHLH